MKAEEDIQSLIHVLKIALKTRGITYKILAKKLKLSEASVKRTFSKGEMTLSRLAKICQIADMSLQDLISMGNTVNELTQHIYTEEQEKAFIKRPTLLAFLNHLLSGQTAKQIKDSHKLTWQVTRSHLNRLEKLGFLEVHENDKIKLLIPKKVQWRKNGPLRKHFLPMALNEFLNSEFSSNDELKKFVNIKLSTQSIRRFQSQIDDLVAEISKVSKIEQTINKKLNYVGILLAIRPWQLSILKNLSVLQN